MVGLSAPATILLVQLSVVLEWVRSCHAFATPPRRVTSRVLTPREPTGSPPPVVARSLVAVASSSLLAVATVDPSTSGPVVAADSNDEERSAAPPPAHLVFPGGGIFFYWQAGVVTHLRNSNYDLSSVSMSGASAGALTATLTTADVDFADATNLALELAEEAGVWDRSEGLQGIWGPLIERWLHELLPSNAHEIANERGLNLLVTPVPSFGKTRVSTFETKRDLIRANMASVHLPWFLDGRFTTVFRNGMHVDGSFLARPDDYVPPESEQRSVVRLDWTEDPNMPKKFGDFVKVVSRDGIWDMVEKGRTYAAEVLEPRGDFENLPRA